MEVDDNIEVSTVTMSAKRSEAVEVTIKDFRLPFIPLKMTKLNSHLETRTRIFLSPL